ncbi:hypothetical protein GCM10007881_44440 [Mesorhizobium huakuii]|nr:hypothetical protein GCM10007881_44440 [Mesorhizobium huakuii]
MANVKADAKREKHEADKSHAIEIGRVPGRDAGAVDGGCAAQRTSLRTAEERYRRLRPVAR